MKLYYDFHIHTALSPCGDDDMTPNNIVNMSLLKGLDAIAITDHNSALNVRACYEVGKEAGLVVVPGIEVETSEEVHIVGLFATPDKAEQMGDYLSCHMPCIKNRVDIFGHQYVMNKKDEIVSEIENLLSTACALDIYQVTNKIKELGGVAIPAHIDKASYSVISNLGFIPSDLEFTAFEIKDPSKKEDLVNKHCAKGSVIIHNSDAHFLWDIHEKVHYLDAFYNSPEEIVNYLKQNT